MIFMHNQTGELVELLVKSVTDDSFTEIQTGAPLFRIAEISMHNENRLNETVEILMSDFYKHFTFVGFI